MQVLRSGAKIINIARELSPPLRQACMAEPK
jgi:hypothetical protein